MRVCIYSKTRGHIHTTGKYKKIANWTQDQGLMTVENIRIQNEIMLGHGDSWAMDSKGLGHEHTSTMYIKTIAD